MARLALSDALGRRRGGSGGALSRPGLSREIGRDWAKVFLGKAFGDGYTVHALNLSTLLGSREVLKRHRARIRKVMEGATEEE